MKPPSIRREQNGRRRAVLAQFGRMVQVWEVMPVRDRLELRGWEVEIGSDGGATSDWPGWARYGIEPHPAPIPLDRPKPTVQKQLIPDHLRWEVWERDNFTCLQCGVRRYLSIDHIIPEARGGETTLENLQTLCRRCNSAKGARL